MSSRNSKAGKSGNRNGVDAAKASAHVSADRDLAAFGPDTSPADGLKAARELLGPDAEFSHFKGGYPVYKVK